MSTVLFWQLFCLGLFVALFVSFWTLSKIEDASIKPMTRDISQDHGLNDSNRERSESAFHYWH